MKSTLRHLRPALAAALIGCVAIAGLPPAAAEAPQTAQALPSIRLNAGIHNIDAMVARSPEERSTGLMWRREMPQQAGMLFVFDQPATQCFWMKNTLLPLSAAFIADDGTVVNIVDMQPESLQSHCSARPVRFVLEMNQGWFARRHIGPGFRLSGPPFSR